MASFFPFCPKPLASFILSIIPSMHEALPYTTPLFIQAIVFFPITLLGASSAILGSCAVLDTSESTETLIPGSITPPM